jgi:hypothetical protein
MRTCWPVGTIAVARDRRRSGERARQGVGRRRHAGEATRGLPAARGSGEAWRDGERAGGLAAARARTHAGGSFERERMGPRASSQG